MACATIYIYLIYLDMYSMKHVAAILIMLVCKLLILAHLSDVKAIELVVFKIQNLIHDFRVLIRKDGTSGQHIDISWQKRILSKNISKIIEHCVTQHSIII